MPRSTLCRVQAFLLSFEEELMPPARIRTAPPFGKGWRGFHPSHLFAPQKCSSKDERQYNAAGMVQSSVISGVILKNTSNERYATFILIKTVCREKHPQYAVVRTLSCYTKLPDIPCIICKRVPVSGAFRARPQPCAI